MHKIKKSNCAVQYQINTKRIQIQEIDTLQRQYKYIQEINAIPRQYNANTTTKSTQYRISTKTIQIQYKNWIPKEIPKQEMQCNYIQYYTQCSTTRSVNTKNARNIYKNNSNTKSLQKQHNTIQYQINTITMQVQYQKSTKRQQCNAIPYAMQ